MAIQTLFETLSLSVWLEQQEVSSPVVLCPAPCLPADHALLEPSVGRCSGEAWNVSALHPMPSDL